MPSAWKPLPWDSEFFGFPIGTVDLDGATLETVKEVEKQARDAGISCLYGSHDSTNAALSVMVQRCGFRFVDAATTFELRTTEPPIPNPSGVKVRAGNVEDIPAVEDIALQMAAWSRYAIDPRFGHQQACRLQRAWLERAARGDDGVHSLLVAEQDDAIVAFIGRVARPHPRVDAVGTARQGSGAARFLIETARAWAGDVPLLGGPIAARNVAALRYVSHCNYRTREVRYLYHRWLDEDVSSP